ncbi:hypothetical protein TNCV_1946881 [Trichonephila clavipes]|nr:hypothetical protein TNCV_1946881 [Trichonephila clavipes]
MERWKKDGTMRLGIDHRKLNKKIIKDRYPLPIIEDVLDKLGNGKIFTTLDLKNAFFHVDVDEASRKYTAFVTEAGQYEFLKVLFGLSISSNYFQRYIDYVFRELLRDGTLIIYLDDIIIPATDEKEAYKKLVRVLETDENIRDIKKLLPSSKTEFILNNNVLFKICEKKELLVVTEMMQANVIRKVHSFRHFAVTKTEELVRRDCCFPNMRKCVENVIKDCVECKLANKRVQEENGRTYHRKRKKSSISERRVANNLSARTIRRHLQQKGLSARRPLLGLPLTQNHRRLRRQWCDERKMWVAELNEVVFTDESRICLQPHDGRIRIELLPWPARSLDLSPIEKMCSMVAQRLTQINPQMPHQISFGSVWKLLGLYGLPRRLGQLKDISKFDNEFFGVSENEALFFNPQGRMLLETTYEAIVDAGYNPDELRGGNVGVFVANSYLDTHEFILRDAESINEHVAPGYMNGLLASRISHVFGFKGSYPLFIIGGRSSSEKAQPQENYGPTTHGSPLTEKTPYSSHGWRT